MKKFTLFLGLTFSGFLLCALVFSQKSEFPVKWISFDEIIVNEELHLRAVEDKITNIFDTIIGNYVILKEGVYGSSLLLDGYSAYLFSNNLPDLKGSFSVEGWLAPGAYPTNYCPVAEQINLENKGFSLGIDHRGFPYFKIGTQNGWVIAEGTDKIPLLSWAHISGVYDEENITLYVNGQKAGQKEVFSTFIPANDQIFYSGISSYKDLPVGFLKAYATEPVHQFFDGLLDEIKIWDGILTEKDFYSVRDILTNIQSPVLEKRALPKLPDSDNFGVFYTRLKYYESWDNFWRTEGLPDVVVSFGKGKGHFVFWRGTSFIPHWVTENGTWYNDECLETWSEKGCHDPFNDKRCHYSHVKIIENTPARCIVHWRYALTDNWNTISNIDPVTGWGDWVDEIYTIYPDGVAVRSQTLHSINLNSRFEWHEAIILMGQGQRPEDVLYPEALTMANMKGTEQVYSWKVVDTGEQKEGITYVKNIKGKWLTELPDANIQLINTRSELKPFTIINPIDEPKWDYYWTSFRPDVSLFPWWNHWPTALKPSDGRFAMDSDRASHTALSHVRDRKPYKKTEYSETKLMLVGLTKDNAKELIPLASSWCTAPKMKVTGENIIDKGYQIAERAYHLEYLASDKGTSFNIELDCSPVLPSINPAFVISNWNKKEITVKINNKKVKEKDSFSYGIDNNVVGGKLIIWFHQKFDNPVNIEVLGK